MRPYMLWLARVYGQGHGTMPMLAEQWPNVVSDWARRLREHEFERVTYPPLAPRAMKAVRNSATGRCTQRGILGPVERQLVARYSARGAVQGER